MIKASFTLIIFILCISALIGGFCWTYTINTWLDFIGKSPNHIKFWQGAIIGFIPYIGQVSLPAAGATWIAQLFLK